MKSCKLVKSTIVSALFVLTVIFGLCLYHNIHVSNTKTNHEKLIDSLEVAQKLLTKCIKTLDGCAGNPDSLKKIVYGVNKKGQIRETDKREIDLLSNVVLNNSASVLKDLKNNKNEISKIKKALESLENKCHNDKKGETSKYRPALWTIVLFIITVVLFAAFLTSLILFSGISKLFKMRNRNKDQMNNKNQSQEQMVHNGAAETTSKIIEPVVLAENMFNIELPKLELSYKITPGQNLSECIIAIKCTREDAKIVYCIFPETNNVINYKRPITVNCRCKLLVTAVCGNVSSKQLEISVDPAEINSEQNRIRVFTSQPNVLGISYQGDNHIKTKPAVPCQDCHSFKKVNEDWSIAIVSDGAGSKEHSDVGSNAVCAAFASYLSQKLQTDRRYANGNIPNERIWDLEFRAMLTQFQSDLKKHKTFVTYGFESLAATIVVLAYSKKGYLFAHVGDGRAGVKINGEWKSILTPHKGEEANQTIFSTTVEFINKPTLMMSGVFVPETKVEECDIEAFVLMSDGCEGGAWATYQRVNLPNGDFRVEDVNQPRQQTLDELIAIIDSNGCQKAELLEFITGYNKGFKTEGDDKTILIGRIK